MVSSISASWAELTVAQQVFFGIGVVAGVVALVMGVMSAIGLEHHDVVTLPDSIGWDAGGGGIFSIKPLTGFLLGFGWAGDRKSTRLNSSHTVVSRMPSSA